MVAEAGDGAPRCWTCLPRRHHPDVVLTDIQMPGVAGLEVTRLVTAEPDPPAVLVLTTFDLDEYVHTALRHGTTGFLIKDTPPRELVKAVHVVGAARRCCPPRSPGGCWPISPPAAGPPRPAPGWRRSPPGEREVAVAVGPGSSNAEIARALGVIEATVKVHLGWVMAKTGADNRRQAAILMHDAGLT